MNLLVIPSNERFSVVTVNDPFSMKFMFVVAANFTRTEININLPIKQQLLTSFRFNQLNFFSQHEFLHSLNFLTSYKFHTNINY